MKPATTAAVARRFSCPRRTRVSAHLFGIDGRLHQVARHMLGHVVEQAAMAETRHKEAIAQRLMRGSGTSRAHTRAMLKPLIRWWKREHGP